jgi:hypothetical protein
VNVRSYLLNLIKLEARLRGPCLLYWFVLCQTTRCIQTLRLVCVTRTPFLPNYEALHQKHRQPYRSPPIISCYVNLFASGYASVHLAVRLPCHVDPSLLCQQPLLHKRPHNDDHCFLSLELHRLESLLIASKIIPWECSRRHETVAFLITPP